jgi:hypothetical protein
MKTLICTGTLFSDWQHTVDKCVLMNSKHISVYDELSTLSTEICQQHFFTDDELTWRSFSPDETYAKKANQLFLSVQNTAVFSWADANSSLFLDFLQTAAADAKFVLFYSTPEYELTNYLAKHSFDVNDVKKVIGAWAERSRSILTFFLNHRDNSLLLNSQSVRSEIGLFIKTMNEKFGLNFDAGAASTGEQSEKSVLMEYLATSLLLDNEDVSEIFDEVRSSASIICEQDKNFENIHDRNLSLIASFLDEIFSFEQLTTTHGELKEELFLKQIQINQVTEELEYYYKKNKEQNNIFADYLSADPLLKVIRQVRQTR